MPEHHIAISLTGGVIRWGYRHAAAVTTWAYDYGVLVAELTDVHPIVIRQTPLVFVVSNAARGRPDFRRELVNVAVEGSRLTAQLTPRSKG